MHKRHKLNSDSYNNHPSRNDSEDCVSTGAVLDNQQNLGYENDISSNFESQAEGNGFVIMRQMILDLSPSSEKRSCFYEIVTSGIRGIAIS
jgi:hypothetical protein